DGGPRAIEGGRWRFARVAGDNVGPDARSGIVPDPRYIWVHGGFEKGRLYQVTYTAVGAPVLGLGIAALRDSVAWLKHGTPREGNPAPAAIRYANAYGRSQTRRLLRTRADNEHNLHESAPDAPS